MASPAPSVPGRPDAAGLPITALIEEPQRIPEPALLHLSGGRVAGVNRAATRLFDLPGVDMTIDELVVPHDSRDADGNRVIRGDPPNIRALRGEVVDQGEILYANGAIGRLVGLPAEALIGEAAARFIDDGVIGDTGDGDQRDVLIRRVDGGTVPALLSSTVLGLDGSASARSCRPMSRPGSGARSSSAG